MTYGDSDMPIAQPVGCRLCSRNDDDDDDDDDEAEEKDVMLVVFCHNLSLNSQSTHSFTQLTNRAPS